MDGDEDETLVSMIASPLCDGMRRLFNEINASIYNTISDNTKADTIHRVSPVATVAEKRTTYQRGGFML
jgi:hypothetical protein